MLFRLTWRSFLKQYRSYAIPFLCMTLAVMSFYSFSAITYDQLLIERASQDIQLDSVLNIGSFFVLAIVLFFMLSANRFFMAKRRKEIALYQLFGLKRRRIIGRFLVETFFLNSVSFISGIALGIILSKLFSMILSKAMALDVESRFFIAFPAVVLTANVFFLVYLILAFQNIWILSQKKLLELFAKDVTVPLTKIRSGKRNIFFGILSFVLIGTGYFLASQIHDILFGYIGKTKDFMIILWLPLLIFVLCVAGTYLFYRFSVTLLVYFWRRRPKSYQGLTLYMLNNSCIQILRSWRSLSLTTIISAIAITIVGISISLITVNAQNVRNSQPTDFQIRKEDLPQLKQLIQEEGSKVIHEVTLEYKVTGTYFGLKLLNTAENNQEQLINLLTIDNYNQFRKIKPELPPIQLESAHDTILFDTTYNDFRGIASFEHQITLSNDVQLQIQRMYPDHLGESLLRYNSPVLVVDQEIFDKTAGISYQVAMVDVDASADREKLSNELNQKLPLRWQDEVYYEYMYQNDVLTGKIQKEKFAEEGDFFGTGSRMNQTSQYPALRRTRRQAGVFIYVALFVSMIVMVATASILMLHQFSEAENEKRYYQLLKKIGVSKKEIRKLVYQQNAWFFVPPVILGTSHALFVIYVLNQFIISDNYWLAYLFCGIMAVAYLIFYMITVRIYLRIVED